jgi:iron complex outermembrane receptor protein
VLSDSAARAEDTRSPASAGDATVLPAVTVTQQKKKKSRAPAPARDVTELPTITVTAQKRSEDAQSVPISMTVLESGQLQSVSPAASNADIARRTPNFNYVDSGGQYANSGNIRGVGSFSPLSPNDTSISYNIDEVPQSAYGLPPSTLDMARVEVMKGPQGTLYGLNAQGGAINYVPQRPFFGHELTLGSEIGTNGWRMGQLIANETLIDNVLAGRLALRYNGRNGDFGNAVLGGNDGGTNIGSARGSLLFTPNADTDVLFSFNYDRMDDSQPRFVLKNAYCFPCDGLNPRPDFRREDYGANLRIEHNFDAFKFTSLSSIQQNTFRQTLDLTDSLVFSKLLGRPQSFFDVNGKDYYQGNIDETRYYQEFRLSSLEGSPIAWTGGANFFRSDSSVSTNGQNFTLPNFSAFSGQQNNELVVNSYSAFGDVTVPIIGGLKAIGGLRLTHADTDVTYRYTGGGLPGTVASFLQNSSYSDTLLTGRAGLSYDWSPQFMTYATVGRGAVGGGYAWNGSNVPTGQPEPFFPASASWTYEAGFKSTLLDNRMTLNAALFYNDVAKGHLYVFNRSLLTYQTAALDFDSYGGEIEARFQVTPEFSLQGGLGYTHAELKDVPANSPTGAKSGNRVPNVPALSATIGGEYRIDASRIGIDQGQVYVSGSYQFVGDRSVDVANSYTLAAYGIANARIGWDGNSTKVYAFANNLFDTRYEAVGTYYGPGVEAVRVGLGRTVGLGINVSF